jgi:DNA modification methylase
MSSSWRIIEGDCLEVMARGTSASIDAIVCDPPYGLGFMGKKWDVLPPGVPWAQECLRVLRPGGHLLAFGGSRTSHRLVCAIEDAGFEIRDTIAWLYGTGFPKSLNVSKAIDKASGAEREVVGEGRWAGVRGTSRAPAQGASNGGKQGGYNMAGCPPVTAPATPEAERWDGWGTALKPAHEPIVVARKPLTGTVAANVLAHGTGAINVDGCRIGTGQGGAREGEASADRRYTANGATNFAPTPGPRGGDALGRWPANVVLDEQAAAMLDEQTGDLRSGSGPLNRNNDKFRNTYGAFSGGNEPADVLYGDSGGASRFLYIAKASSAERNAGLDGFEEKPLRPDGAAFGEMTMWNGQNGDDAWRAKNPNKPRANVHPTVKPISLMRWLVRLVTPPGGTVLDPFAGSGTTGIASVLEGFRFIGIEREVEYVAIANARIAHWDPVVA